MNYLIDGSFYWGIPHKLRSITVDNRALNVFFLAKRYFILFWPGGVKLPGKSNTVQTCFHVSLRSVLCYLFGSIYLAYLNRQTAIYHVYCLIEIDFASNVQLTIYFRNFLAVEALGKLQMMTMFTPLEKIKNCLPLRPHGTVLLYVKDQNSARVQARVCTTVIKFHCRTTRLSFRISLESRQLLLLNNT